MSCDQSENWKEVDKGNAVAVAFIDFKKAFDYVHHKQLLTKLQGNFGILGPLHNWLKRYLSNRLQYTVVNDVKSKMQSVSAWIPQGSVLKLTLFALYTSNLPSSVPSGETYLFADDTTIYRMADGKWGPSNTPTKQSTEGALLLAPVVETMDSAVHRINHYPADKH